MYDVLKAITAKPTEGIIKFKIIGASEISFIISLANRTIDQLKTLFDSYDLFMYLKDELGQKELQIQYYVDGEVLEYLKIEPIAVSPDLDAFHNLKKMLGFELFYSEGNIDKTPAIDQGHVISDYFGYRLPLRSYFDDDEIQGGLTKPQPISKQRTGNTYVDNDDVYSTPFNIKRGWNFSFRGSQKWLDLFDDFLRAYDDEVFKFETSTNLYSKFSKIYKFLPHESSNASLVYDTIMLYEIPINILEV